MHRGHCDLVVGLTVGGGGNGACGFGFVAGGDGVKEEFGMDLWGSLVGGTVEACTVGRSSR